MKSLLFISVLSFLTVPVKQAFWKDVPMTNDVHDCFKGSVRAVSIEKAGIIYKGGAYVEGPRILKRESAFDPDGRKTLELNYDAHGARPTKKVFGYDPNGKLEVVVEYKPDGSRLSRRVYRYGEGGKKVEEVTYRNVGTPDPHKVISIFDENGRQLSVEIVGAKDRPFVKTYLSYDDEGRIKEAVTYANHALGGTVVSGKGGNVVFPATAKTKMQGAAPHHADLLVSKTTFSYGSSGHVAEIVSYGPDNSLSGKTRFEHKLDSHGNWIEETTSKWDSKTGSYEPSEVTYRTITYY